MQDMVFIPSGEFLMGSTLQEVYRIADVDEFPQRKLWVDDFYIDIHEVTNAQYKVYVDSMKVKAPPKWVNGNYGIGEDGLPVTSITWEEAAAYAKFVGKRLPTEAEWEKAARGSDARWFPWGGTSFDRNYANNGDHLVNIMSYPEGVSPYGVYDMAGNVREWCENLASGGGRFILGGGWSDPPYGFTDGYAQPPADRSAINGIRLGVNAETQTTSSDWLPVSY